MNMEIINWIISFIWLTIIFCVIYSSTILDGLLTGLYILGVLAAVASVPIALFYFFCRT